MPDTTPKEETPRCERCGMPMLTSKPEGAYFTPRCQLPESTCQSIASQAIELAALRSEVEALRKRNEELEKRGGFFATLDAAWAEGMEKQDQRLRADLAAAESRAQEAETKLRAAEEEKRSLSANAARGAYPLWQYNVFDGPPPEGDNWLLFLKACHERGIYHGLGISALALAAQRKREIAEAAAKAAVRSFLRFAQRYKVICADAEVIRVLDLVLAAAQFERTAVASATTILNPEGPDANTENP